MKRLRPIQLAVTLMVMLAPLALPAVNTIIHTVNYGSSGMTVGTDTLGGVTYTTVNYGELFNSGEPGKPSLPVDYLKFSVPYNATNFSVTATLSNNMTQYIDHLVYPCQPPRMMSDTTPVVITLPDSATYYSNSFYPSQAAWVVDEGFLAGENHIVTVAVMPIAFKHKTGMLSNNDQLRRSGTVRLTLRYDLSDSLAMYPIVRNDTALRNEGYHLTQSMVVNPTNVDAYAPDIYMDTMMVINPNSGDGLNVLPPYGLDFNPIDTNTVQVQEVSFPYLIVTTPELKHSMRRLAALKGQKGYGVEIVTMDDVMNDSTANQGDKIRRADGSYYIAYNDNAGKLREFLKRCYFKYGTQYVLLAGKSIPYRLKHFYKDTVPSDLYFSDLNADWSADTVDRAPELYVGRIMPQDDEHVNNYTDKLLRYELNPGNGDRNYLKRALYTEGHDMRYSSISPNPNEVNTLCQFANHVFPDSCVMRENISANRRFPSGVDIVNEINNTKYGYLSFHNHAFPSGLLTYGHRIDPACPDDTPFHFLWAIDSVRLTNGVNTTGDFQSGNGLNNITNKDFPCVTYSVGCTTMPFDTPSYFESNTLNFGESFTLGKDYGGPAFLGNTRDGVIGYSSSLEISFIQELIGFHYNIGKAEALSKSNFCGDHSFTENNTTIIDKSYLNCVHNLLGDPEFEIWTNTPQEFTNVQVTRSDDRITVSGDNINSATIACYSNDGKWRKTVPLARVSFTGISPNSTVMVYKHNYIPYIAPLLLQNENLSNSQYVIASDVIAGAAVDSNRTQGDVVITSGVEYEIEASGTVTLQNGFKVEKGATFAVYPSCY